MFSKMRKFKVMWLLVTMLFLVMALTACGNTKQPAANTGGSKETAGKSADLVPVRYGYLVSDQLHQYALPIGLAKGWFEEEGIKITKKEYTAAGVLTQAFAAGDFDIGVVGVTGALLAVASGADIVMVTSNNYGGSALVTEKSINSFPELAGKQVGHPGIGSNHNTLLNLLEQKFKTNVVKPTIKPTDMPIFATNGEVSGVICYEPHPTKVMQEAGFKRLMGSNEILENQQCCVVITSSKFLKEHPDIVQKVVKLNARATRFIIDKKDEALTIIADASGHKRALLEAAYDNMIYPWPAKVNVESSAVLLQGLLDAKKIDPKVVTPDSVGWINSLYNRSFEQALIDNGYIKQLETKGAQ